MQEPCSNTMESCFQHFFPLSFCEACSRSFHNLRQISIQHLLLEIESFMISQDELQKKKKIILITSPIKNNNNWKQHCNLVSVSGSSMRKKKFENHCFNDLVKMGIQIWIRVNYNHCQVNFNLFVKANSH